VGVRRQEVNMLDAGGKGAERLNAIDAKKNVPFVQRLADGVEFQAPARDKMVRRQRDQAGLLIGLADDVDGPDAAVVPGVEEADFDAFLRQGHPGIDVGRVVVEVRQNVVALAQRQAAGDEAQRQRSWADEGDLLRLGAQEAGGHFARAADAGGGKGLLLLGQHGAGGVLADRLGDAARQGADGGVCQKGLFSRHGEFVPAQFFVGQDFGDRHFMSMTLFSS
jgi:hypothetical protein